MGIFRLIFHDIIGIPTKEDREALERWRNSEEYKKQQAQLEHERAKKKYSKALSKYKRAKFKAEEQEKVRRLTLYNLNNSLKSLSSRIENAHKKNNKELEMRLKEERDEIKKEIESLSTPIEIPNERPVWTRSEQAPDESDYDYQKRSSKTTDSNNMPDFKTNQINENMQENIYGEGINIKRNQATLNEFGLAYINLSFITGSAVNANKIFVDFGNNKFLNYEWNPTSKDLTIKCDDFRPSDRSFSFTVKFPLVDKYEGQFTEPFELLILNSSQPTFKKNIAITQDIVLSKEQKITDLEKDIKIAKLEKELAELKKSQDSQD